MKNFLLLALLVVIFSCTKHAASSLDPEPAPTPQSAARLSYGDSTFYIRDNSGDYIVSPVAASRGTYKASPEGLTIDSVTGAINITKSETGLRYKIRFTPSGNGAADSAYIIISGLNYYDHIYNFSQNDTIAYPIYNADASQALPAGNYALGTNKVAINNANGQIDLKKSIRNGLFNDDPQNDAWRDIKIEYKSNDNSANAKNSMEMIIYYYRTVNDIPSNVSALMRQHQTMLFGRNTSLIPVTTAPADIRIDNIVSISKPRPPCVIIVGN